MFPAGPLPSASRVNRTPTFALIPAAAMRAPVHPVAHLLRFQAFPIDLLPASLVAAKRDLVILQQVRRQPFVRLRGASRPHASHDSAAIRSDVKYHPEVSTLALSHHLHRRITRTRDILHRTRCCNEHRLHDCRRPYSKIVLRQQDLHRLEAGIHQSILFWSVAELQERILVRDVVVAQFHPPPRGKVAHRPAFTDRVLGL